MSFIDDAINKKEQETPFVKLKDIGDTIKVFRVMEMDAIPKVGFGGKKTTALAFKFLVEYGQGVLVEKTWDNSALSTFRAVRDAGITVGSSFTLTRGGENTKEKTVYIFSDVVNPPQKDATKPATPATPAPATQAPVKSATPNPATPNAKA